jgi:hypothetical protein
VNVRRSGGLALAWASSLVVAAPAATVPGGPAEISRLADSIRKQRAVAWDWQRVMGKRTSPTRYLERKLTSVTLLSLIRDHWRFEARKARSQATAAAACGRWLCIHGHEGAWKRSRRALLRRSPDGPLVPGGLRLLPLRTKGTADNWLPLEQMWTAEKALRAGRGFYPGPRPPASAASCSGPFAPARGLTSATPFSARSSGQGLKARPCSAVPASARMRPRGQPFRPERSRSDRAARRASFQATSGV